MKRFPIFIFCLCFCKIVFGQIPPAVDTSKWKERKKDKLDGFYVLPQKYDALENKYEPMDEKDTLDKMLYDREGREIELMTNEFDPKSGSQSNKFVAFFYYDDTGKLISCVNHLSNSDNFRMDSFFYDAQNKLKTELHYGKKKDGIYKKTGYSAFLYWENGLLKEKIDYDTPTEWGSFIPSSSDNFFYDKNGNKVQCVSFDYMKMDTAKTDTSIYDSRGNRILFSEFDFELSEINPDSTRAETFRIESTYDNQNNLIESKVYFRSNDTLKLTDDDKYIFKNGVEVGRNSLDDSMKYIFDDKQKDKIIGTMNYNAHGTITRKRLFFETHYQ